MMSRSTRHLIDQILISENLPQPEVLENMFWVGAIRACLSDLLSPQEVEVRRQ